MPYTVRLKTTKGSEKPPTITAFKVAIEQDMHGKYDKKTGTITFNKQTFTYTVDAIDREEKLIFVTVDDTKLPPGY